MHYRITADVADEAIDSSPFHYGDPGNKYSGSDASPGTRNSSEAHIKDKYKMPMNPIIIIFTSILYFQKCQMPHLNFIWQRINANICSHPSNACKKPPHTHDVRRFSYISCRLLQEGIDSRYSCIPLFYLLLFCRNGIMTLAALTLYRCRRCAIVGITS